MVKNCKEWMYEDGEYAVGIYPDCKIRERMGRIRKKNNGRWDWFRWESRHHKEWNKGKQATQGVVETFYEAAKQLQEGWPIELQGESDLDKPWLMVSSAALCKEFEAT